MKGVLKIDEERCKGCLLCANFCPRKILGTSEKLNSKGFFPVTLIKDECNACAICARVCPDVAINVYKIRDITGH